MATPADTDKETSSQDEEKQTDLNESPVSDTNGSNEPTTNEGPETTSTSAGSENTNVEENGRVSDAKEDGSRHVGGRAEVASTAAPRDQNVEASSSGQSDIALSPADTSNTLDVQNVGQDDGETDNSEFQTPADPAVDAAAQSEANTGENTPLDGASTPTTPRSAPAKPSVFKKSTIQKVKLNQDFLKNASPSNSGPQPTSTTPRPMTNDKRTIHPILSDLAKASSTASKALKPMVRNRLSNLGGTMERQGSGSSTPKSGRGSPHFGRPGSGSEVWSWRRTPATAKEYTEEELLKQGVHLTARLGATTGDDANKWADMDDDWSEEEVEETKDVFESTDPRQENHVDEHPVSVAPHLLESAALGRLPDRPEETIVVSKNERFADVTYDRRDTRSPDQNIHGQRQIYNPKLGRFEDVQPQAGREQERHSRRNVEIMQRNGGKRESNGGQRRESFARNDENRQRRGSWVENKGLSPSIRRTSFAERDSNASLHHHPRRDSVLSNSAISDADRSLSNASPSVDTQPPEHVQAIDLIALQHQQMADSRKRAMERRAKDEEDRLAAAERARKKAEQLGVATASPVSRPTSAKIETPKASPIPPSAKLVANAQETLSKTRSDSGGLTRDEEEIIRKDSPLKEEATPKRSAWGAIGSSQTNTSSQKHQQNGLFGNPNTLAAINHTISGDAPRRGRNAPRPQRAPVNPTNVPASLQGWASFAGNVDTRKAHDDERQHERNQERDKLDKEKGNTAQRSTNLVDKWKRVEIKEPENAGDVAGRTVVSVLKSGYVEDSSGKVEVRELPVSQRNRSEVGGSSAMANNMTSDSSSSLTGPKSPALTSTTPGLGMPSPTTSTLGDKTPGSRDRSRFFPSPSTVVDMSPRVVHSIQPPLHAEKSVFPPPLFSAFEDLAKTQSSIHGSSPSRKAMSQYGNYGQLHPTSPVSALAAPPQIGGLTPRTAFSHTIPMTSPPPPLAQKPIKFPTLSDFDNVLSKIRESMQTSSLQESSDSSTKESADPTQHENIPQSTSRQPVDPVVTFPQTQTRIDPQESDMQNYLKISAISPNRDLEISTRDVDEEPVPKPTVKVSLPKQFYTSSREMDIPIDMTARPRINLPTKVVEFTNTPDAKSRIKNIDKDFPAKVNRNYHPINHAQHGVKIPFSPSLTPRGDVVPDLIKKDKNGKAYVNFVAKSESLTLPSYASDHEIFYAHREGGKRKYQNNKKPINRKPIKGDRFEGSTSQSGKTVAGQSRPEKK